MRISESTGIAQVAICPGYLNHAQLLTVTSNLRRTIATGSCRGKPNWSNINALGSSTGYTEGEICKAFHFIRMGKTLRDSAAVFELQWYLECSVLRCEGIIFDACTDAL
jgi:hypothetical protein